MSLQKTVFGMTKAKPNTFIGGVSGTINTPALVASKLGINVNRIKAFSVIGSNIQFAVTGGSYSIPASAFLNSGLTYYNDPDGLVTLLGISSFSGCPNVISFSFNNLITVSQYSIYNCINLETITAPNLTNSTSGYSFASNPKLKDFYAPNFILKSTNLFAFFGDINLENLTIGKPTGLGGGALQDCRKITFLDLSEATTIANDACLNTYLLSNIVSLNSATSIGNNAFRSSGISGHVSCNSNISLGVQSFSGCPDVTSFSFNNLITVSQYSIYNCINLETITAPNLTSSTSSYSFASNPKLKDFYAPNFILKSTNPFAFFGDINLENLTIGKPTGLGGGALHDCRKITFLDLSEATTIANDACLNTYLLSNIVSLNSATSIGNNAFRSSGISGHISVNSAISLGLYTFFGCEKATSYSLNNVNSISNVCFSNNLLVEFIFMPLLANCGTTVSLNSVFENIKSGCTITVPLALQTANAGAPDGDLVYAATSRGATIVYV